MKREPHPLLHGVGQSRCSLPPDARDLLSFARAISNVFIPLIGSRPSFYTPGCADAEFPGHRAELVSPRALIVAALAFVLWHLIRPASICGTHMSSCGSCVACGSWCREIKVALSISCVDFCPRCIQSRRIREGYRLWRCSRATASRNEEFGCVAGRRCCLPITTTTHKHGAGVALRLASTTVTPKTARRVPFPCLQGTGPSQSVRVTQTQACSKPRKFQPWSDFQGAVGDQSGDSAEPRMVDDRDTYTFPANGYSRRRRVMARTVCKLLDGIAPCFIDGVAWGPPPLSNSSCFPGG